MKTYVINIFYRNKRTPPEVLVDIVDNNITEGVFVTRDKGGLITGIPLDTVERFEIVEEEAVDV